MNPQEVAAYNTAMLEEAREMLATAWQTSCMEIPDSMKTPFMTCVKLPAANNIDKTQVHIFSFIDRTGFCQIFSYGNP